ncbi:MAG: DUF507 family protein [bacterium]
MRLYTSRVPMIAQEVVRHLVEKAAHRRGPGERQRSRAGRRVGTRRSTCAPAPAHRPGQGSGPLSGGWTTRPTRRSSASSPRRAKFGLYEDAVGYIANQLIETFLHTRHVDEIFAADNDLRSAIAPVVRRHMSSGDELDAEVRKRIKNLQEGTQDWEIRYQQTLERLKVARGLTDE